MSIADIIVLLVVFGALSLALRYLRRHRPEDGCGGSCGTCSRKEGGCLSGKDGQEESKS